VKFFALIQVKLWVANKGKYQKAYFLFLDWCINPLTCIKLLG